MRKAVKTVWRLWNWLFGESFLEKIAEAVRLKKLCPTHS